MLLHHPELLQGQQAGVNQTLWAGHPGANRGGSASEGQHGLEKVTRHAHMLLLLLLLVLFLMLLLLFFMLLLLLLLRVHEMQ